MKALKFSRLAMSYFPDYSRYWAREKMKELIYQNPVLNSELQGVNFYRRSFFFTPRLVALIYEQLGEP